MDKQVRTISIMLLFLMGAPIVHAAKSECYNGLITIEVEAPNEVQPGEEFQIDFRIYATFSDVYVSHIRVELWTMGSYKKETLLQNALLKPMGIIPRNMTFMLNPSPPYPNVVFCDLWILCREEGAEDQFSHCRSAISWCTLSTYDELIADYNNLTATYNELDTELKATREELSNIRNLMYIFIATTIVVTAITVYLAKRKLRIP